MRYTKQFKFEETWIKYDKCTNLIESIGVWGNSEGVSLSHNLNSCANVLGSWGRNVLLNQRNKIKYGKKALNEAYEGLPATNFDDIHKIEFELDNLLEEEEIYWKQKSRGVAQMRR